MIWTSFVLYQLYIIVMYFFQGVTLFSTCYLIKFTEGADDRRNSLSRGWKNPTKNKQKTTHKKILMFSANACFCSSNSSQILSLLSPTQAIFFKWCVLNLNPVNRSTVSLGNELFLCRIGERWVLGSWRGHLGAFVIWKYRRT